MNYELAIEKGIVLLARVWTGLQSDLEINHHG